MARGANDGGLERDIVVHIVELPRGLLGRLAFAGRDRRLVLVAPLARACVPHSRAAAEHLHALGNDLGGVALLPLLVLPLARAQGALDVDLRALLQIFPRDLGEAVEEHHAMPLGALLFFAALLVFPGFAGRDRDVRDGASLGVVPGLRVPPEVSHENYLVYGCHDFPLSNFGDQRGVWPLARPAPLPRSIRSGYTFSRAPPFHGGIDVPPPFAARACGRPHSAITQRSRFRIQTPIPQADAQALEETESSSPAARALLP